jgi:branched-chain amino acid transport system ATP-binding protein
VTEPDAPPLLQVRDLSVHHGQLQALREVSLAVPAGTVHAMIGANGAGKSTLLRTIAGLHRPTTGRILLDGTDLTGLRPEQRVGAGVVMVPEGRRLFPTLTLEENLLVGTTNARPGPWTLPAVYELFDWMADRRGQRAAQLSGGEQQAVAIGRALVANPRVLLLDELSLGLAPVVVRRIYALLPKLLDAGVTVLLVEQDVSQALGVASMVHCLLEGRITLEGEPAGLTPAQIESAYFGASRHDGAANGGAANGGGANGGGANGGGAPQGGAAGGGSIAADAQGSSA